MVGNVAIISGADALGPLNRVRATFTVDSLSEYEAHLRSAGAVILQPPLATAVGKNMIAQDAEGVVFEFVELHSMR